VIVDDEPLQRLMRERFRTDHPAVTIRVQDVTLDAAIPSFFIVMQRPTELGPTVCVGSATRLDPRQAIRKCLMEAGQGIPYFRFLLDQLADWVPSDDFTNVTSFDHHCVFYLKRPDLVPRAFAFLDEPDGDVLLSSIADHSTGRPAGDVQRCVRALADAGLEVIVVEITTPDIQDIGMRVVRVIVPGMVPLHGVYKYPFLGSKRLADFPPRHNGNGAALTSRAFDAFNTYPHPFP
jgi:ribosomal protein S12 methylthiotransferase accessory factor